MKASHVRKFAAGIGPRPRLVQYGPILGGAGGQTLMRLGYRGFAVGTLVAGIWLIGVVPAAVDSWNYLKANVEFLKPDPDEMD